MSGEGREHTLSTATAFEKGLFHTKNCFCTCYCSVWCFCCAALPDWQNCFLPKQIMTLIATFYISYISEYATYQTGWKINIKGNFEVINFRLSKNKFFSLKMIRKRLERFDNSDLVFCSKYRRRHKTWKWT